MPVSRIALEEHFWTSELRELRRGHDVLSEPQLAQVGEATTQLRVGEHVMAAPQFAQLRRPEMLFERNSSDRHRNTSRGRSLAVTRISP